MTASALLRHGIGQAEVLLEGLTEWLRRKGFGSVAEALSPLPPSSPPPQPAAANARTIAVRTTTERRAALIERS